MPSTLIEQEYVDLEIRATAVKDMLHRSNAAERKEVLKDKINALLKEFKQEKIITHATTLMQRFDAQRLGVDWLEDVLITANQIENDILIGWIIENFEKELDFTPKPASGGTVSLLFMTFITILNDVLKRRHFKVADLVFNQTVKHGFSSGEFEDTILRVHCNDENLDILEWFDENDWLGDWHVDEPYNVYYLIAEMIEQNQLKALKWLMSRYHPSLEELRTCVFGEYNLVVDAWKKSSNQDIHHVMLNLL